MKYQIAQVIGLNTDQEAAQVISSSRGENNIFFGLLQITCDDAFTKGRQVLSELMDSFFESDEPAAQGMPEVFASAQEKLAEAENINILLGAVIGKALYFIYQGDVAIYLKRSGKLSSLLTAGPNNQLISGFLQAEDRIFLGTASLTNLLGEDLNTSVSSSLNDWEEETTIRISTSSLDTQGLAGLLLEILPEQPTGQTQVLKKHLPDEYNSLSTNNESNITRSDSLVSKLAFLQKLNIFSKFFSKENPPSLGDSDVSAYPEYLSESPGPKRFNLSVKRMFPRSGRARLILGVGLILIVIAGMVYQFQKTKDQERQLVLNQIMQQAREEFAAAESIATLNPQEAKAKLESAKSTVEKALAVKADDLGALELKRKIAEDGDKILQQFAAANFPVYLELNLVKQDFKPERMSLSGNNLLLLDSTSKSLVVVDISKKSHKILAGEEQLGAAKYAVMDENFGFIYSGDKGSLRIDATNQKVTTIAKQDKSLAGVVDIAGFGNNLYLLDKTNNQIWKYVATSSGYADKREYLAKSVKADFSTAKRMMIESSIYVLTSGGELLRYLKGVSESFAYSGLDNPVKDPKSFYVSADTENLYVLDSGNSRLVVVDKAGAYKAQYQGEKFATASELVVDEKNKKVYLLDGGNIYITDLK